MAKLVHEAIKTLNYVPNRAARSLASRRTQAIALVVPETTAKLFTDPFFASIVQGVALNLAETDYTLTMLISSESRPEKTRRYLMGGNVDGAIIVSHHSGDHSYAHLGRALPTVYAGRPLALDATDIHYVDVDNAAGASAATAHLIARGCRTIATIAGPQDMPPGVDRLDGWRSAVTAAGLDDSLVEVGDFTPAGGADAMRRLLDRGVPIDGLFAANDQMAAGAYTVLHERGITVPGDMAVVGFDDDYFGASATPALTTVNQPAIEMGTTLAEIIVKLIDGVPVEHVTRLPTSLVVRDSA